MKIKNPPSLETLREPPVGCLQPKDTLLHLSVLSELFYSPDSKEMVKDLC